MVDLSLLQSVSYIAGALGVCVAASYYVMTLRITQKNQELTLRALEQSAKAQHQTLETRQAQLFMNVYDKASNKEFGTSWQKFTGYKVKTWKEFAKLYTEDKEFNDAYWVTAMFFEGLGVLVREGLLPIKMVALMLGGPIRSYWEMYKPFIEEGRRDMGYSRLLSEVEFLYVELMRFFEEHPELATRIERPLNVP
jgi:hypothetical protein